MTRRLIDSGSRFESDIGYSRAVVDGEWVFVSGTTGFDYATMTLADDVVAQAEQCLQNIESALTRAEARFADVVRVTYIVPNAADFPACWPVLRKYFGDVRPAATMLSAGLADPRMKIEIEVTARKAAAPGDEAAMNPEPRADGVCETSRSLPFPRAEVYAAFADAGCLAAWWGPEGFSNTFEVFEFKPHGRWTFVMHGPGGNDYPNENVFLETSPSTVVIQHLSPPHFTLTVGLTERGGRTLVHWRQAFDDPEVAAGIRHIIEPANEQNLDRLHRVLLNARP